MERKTKQVFIGVTIFGLLTFLFLAWRQPDRDQNSNVMIAGLSPGQKKNFQERVSNAVDQAAFLHEGRRLQRIGDFDGAIENYKCALKEYKGVAQSCIADAYEKKEIIKTL